MKLTIREKRRKSVRAFAKNTNRELATSVFCLFEDLTTGAFFHCNMTLICNQRRSRWGFWVSMEPETSDLFRIELNREMNGFIEPTLVMEFPVNHSTFEMDDDYQIRSLVYKFFTDIQHDHFQEGTVMGVDGSILFDRAVA
jgi:hypothetical protein